MHEHAAAPVRRNGRPGSGFGWPPAPWSAFMRAGELKATVAKYDGIDAALWVAFPTGLAWISTTRPMTRPAACIA